MSGPVLHLSQPAPAPASGIPGEGQAAAPGRAAWIRLGLGLAWGLAALLHLCLGPDLRVRIWPLSYLLLEAAAAASLALRARRAPGESRAAWWMLAASAGLEVPNLALTLAAAWHPLPGDVSVATSSLSLATGVLVLAGVLGFPKGEERPGLFRRRLLDSLIFAASLLFLLWVLGMHAALHALGRGLGFRVFVAFLNVALLGGGLVFMTSYSPARLRGPLGWMCASGGAWLLALSLWTAAGFPQAINREAWISVAGGIPLFQALAAWSAQEVSAASGQEDAERRMAGLLPYLPATIALLVLAAMLVDSPEGLTRSAYGIFLVLVSLLLLRQLQAIEDLKAARRTLEARVVARTRDLELAQDLLMRTERMNTVGLMGAGLAHDLNNSLTAIRSSTELIALGLEEGRPPEQADLDRIAEATDHAARLTGRLMAFAKRESEALSPQWLGDVVAELEATVAFLLPRSIALSVSVDPEPLVDLSSRLRQEQILVNLVANARDAMPQGGRIAVWVAPAPGDPAMAMLEVADTGQGMTREVRERIFDPFFTTKGSGKGTGLGLPSLKAMVEDAGGRVEVFSEPGRGARFRIFLPRMVL